MQCVTDSYCHGRSAHGRGQRTYRVLGVIDCGNCHSQKRNVELCAKGVDDRTDQQGTEKSLCHGSQCIDTVSLQGDLNILPFQKCFEFFHFKTLSLP